MKKRIIYIIIALFALTADCLGASGKFTLVIDAGHGGHDAGALGKITKEKIINLNVALAFGRLVEQNCPDVKVIYTRKDDVFIPLDKRADIANKAGADLFISVHTNAVAAGRTVRGFQTYTLGMHRAKDNLDVAMRENSVISMEKDYRTRYQGFDPKSSESYIMFEFMQTANMEKSVELARMIQRSVCSTAGRTDKGVHQAGFLVLRATSMPSCLIELGFITTPEEEEFLDSQEGVAMMARGIYKAFVEYKNRYSDKIVVPYAAPENQSFNNMGHIVPQNPDAQVEQKPTVKLKQQQPVKKQPTEKQPVKKQPAEKTQPAAKPQPAPAAAKVSAAATGLIFKVQIFALNRTLRPGSQQFKGHKDVDSYREDNTMKYTIGATADYNEILRVKKGLMEDFPQCFIIAFKDGERIDINQALIEYNQKKK